MQQIIYDIIDNCFTYNNKINNPENNSANSDITNTPPQSTNSGSCNSHILSQKENKKIVFNVFRNYKINIINNNENNNLKSILNYLNVNNIEEAKNKIQKLIIFNKFYQQISKLYNESNSCNYNYNKFNGNNILSWIYDIAKYSKNFNYKLFLEDIMKEYNIKDFEELKMIFNNNIYKN